MSRSITANLYQRNYARCFHLENRCSCCLFGSQCILLQQRLTQKETVNGKYYAWTLKTASIPENRNDLSSSQNSGFHFKTEHTHIMTSDISTHWWNVCKTDFDPWDFWKFLTLKLKLHEMQATAVTLWKISRTAYCTFGKLVEEQLQKVQSLWRVLLWKGNYAKYRQLRYRRV